MTVYAVTFDGTRFNQVQDYTNWSNYGGSGAGGAVEPSLAYQNGQCAARKQTVTGGTLGGIQLNDASTVDMTATDRDLWFFKVYIADSFDVNTTEGVRVGIGDGSSASSKSYNLSGSTATNDAYLQYPAQGGYILGAIEPSNTFWPITTAGTIDLTIIDFFGCQGSWINGNAKSLNIAMDAIDIGVGLYLTGGTGADPTANFTSYPEIDQDTTTNRWGCTSGSGSNVAAWCILRAGGTIEFDDTTSIVSFKDGYHGAGYTGILHELDTAAATFTVGATMIGEGKLYNSGAIDTRPDYIVTGTTMTATYNFSCNLRNFRNITFTSKVDCDGADIECQLLTQGSAEIQNSTIRTNALTSVAVLQEPTLGTTSGLHDCHFTQTGAGHALGFATAGNYTLTNLTGLNVAAGYGANATASAGLDLSDTTGTYNITVSGGDTPTYLSGGAAVNIISAVTVTFDKMKDNSEVRVYDSGTGAEIDGIEDATAGTTDNRNFSWSDTAANTVDYVIHNWQPGVPVYKTIRVNGYVVPSTNTTIDIQQIIDRNAE